MNSTHTATDTAKPSRISTGITGMDTILNGGLVPGRSTLVRGSPGVGKTLFGLHYLTAGAINGDTSLFINMGEPEQYLREDAITFGFDTDAIHFLDLTPNEEEFHAEETYDVFAPVEAEGPSLAETITDTVADVEPDRVFIDPITQLRYLIDDPYRFRKQLMALFQFLEETSVVFTSQATQATPDDDLQFLADAVINLQRHDLRRTVAVSKFRGSDFHDGQHSLRITDKGVVVSPRLTTEAQGVEFTFVTLSSGISELDSLLHGGLERGTVTLLSGPTGVGKTTTGLQFLKEAADRGTNAVLYSFEETQRMLVHRAEAINIPIKGPLEQGSLRISEISPDSMSVDEFAQRVRRDVEEHNAEIVMIDSIDGYLSALPDVVAKQDIRNLGRYLRNMGVTTIIANEVHRVTGEFQATEEKISPLADTIVFFRHIEHKGELRKVLGVLKSRTSDFEQTLRELQITEDGLQIGESLPELRGILTGRPDWEAESGE